MKTNLLILCILLGSCTGYAQRKELRKERRQARHERKAEYFRVKAGLPKCTDTIATDTIVVPKEVHDTTFKVTHDTTHYETERVVVKHFYDHTDSTVYVQAECKGDTVIHTVETIKETKTEYRNPLWLQSITGVLRFWWVLVLVFVGAIAVIIGIKFATKVGL